MADTDSVLDELYNVIESRQGGEDPHMADPPEVARRQYRTGHETHIIARHDQTGGHCGKRLKSRPDTDQGALQTIADHHQCEAEEQRPTRAHHSQHR